MIDHYNIKLWPYPSIEWVHCASIIIDDHLITSVSDAICDRICKKGSYTCNYKYLEIPI